MGFRDLDKDQMKSSYARDALSTELFSEIEHEGETYLMPWRRYYFSVPLNTGLARTTDCLPSNIPVRLRFQRAPASYALIKISDKITIKQKSDTKVTAEIDYTYNESVIPILNPVMSLYYAYSGELEQSMSRIRTSKIEIPFYDYVTRRTVLDGGLSNYDVNLVQGDLPKYIIFALSDLERLNGSETLSLTKFVQGELESFDLIFDHESVLEFPLEGNAHAPVAFYQNFLRQTNR